MRIGPVFAALLAAAVLPAQAAKSQKALAKLIDVSGNSAGTATFTATHHGILVELKVTGLNEGAHGVHIHTSGNCDPKMRFMTAGPHFSFEPKAHGFFGKGMHAGDLPNGYAARDGTLRTAYLGNAFTLGNGKKSIFDRDGASIIVTARGDDYASQPDGRSGDRVACGVIIRTVGPASRTRLAAKHRHK
jgi:Cu-Zn family superoxide dismutase